MKNKSFILILICLSMISCVKEQLETTYNKQEDQIDKYITKNMIVTNDEGITDTLRVIRNGGSNRLVTVEGTGEELKADAYEQRPRPCGHLGERGREDEREERHARRVPHDDLQ